jgi:hypothetical protein
LIETPPHLIVTPMDAFSQVLKALRLETGIFLEAEFTAPWCIDSAPGKDDVRQILPSAEHVAIYTCWGGMPRDLSTVPRPSSSPRRPDPLPARRRPPARQRRPAHPLLAETLAARGRPARTARRRRRPHAVHLRLPGVRQPGVPAALLRAAHAARAAGRRAGVLMVETLRHAAEESRAPRAGTDAVLTKLGADSSRPRLYLRRSGAGASWPAGLTAREPRAGADARVAGPPVDRDDPARSQPPRSALAERFTLLIGEPPMHLTRWRLALGARAPGGSEPVIDVARQVATSPEAFNRAFAELARDTPGGDSRGAA